jgi:hypothetical protein
MIEILEKHKNDCEHMILCHHIVYDCRTLNLYSKGIFFYPFQYILFHPVLVFYNLSRFSSSKSIIYINYHPYFTIFSTTSFFFLIPISTAIFSFIYIITTFYLHYLKIIWFI